VPARGTQRRFFAILGVILVVAAGVRIAYVLGEARHDEQFYDAAYYELQARSLVDGRGYNDPFQFLPGAPHRSTPAADHPPLTVFALVPVIAFGDGIGLHEEDTQLLLRFEIALVGLAVVLLIGLLGREVAGDRAGLIAAGLAAIYPYLWVSDGLIMSEAFASAAVAGALLLTFRLLRKPSLGLALAVGLVCGLAALARAELILLAPLLGLPLLFSFRKEAWSRRLSFVAVVAVGALVFVGPWVAFNLSRFEDTTFLSTNDGIAMLASNCDQVYSGSGLGLTDLENCIPTQAPKGDQSVVSRIYRTRAIDYMKAHKSDVPVVVLARIGRDWSLFRPGDMLDWNLNEGRPRWVTGLGLVFYYPLVIAAIGGVVVMKLRKRRQWPLLMPPLIVTVASLLSYGQTRFRSPAEPVLVVLAAIGIAALVARWRPERTSGSSAPDESDPELVSGSV
jgi:4-amino-4-deoxy-L-arabinose transferase-like glycosyltransferase